MLITPHVRTVQTGDPDYPWVVEAVGRDGQVVRSFACEKRFEVDEAIDTLYHGVVEPELDSLERAARKARARKAAAAHEKARQRLVGQVLARLG